MSHLRFLGSLVSAQIENLLDCDWDNVPFKPGAYIFLANPGTKFLYPKGQSPVFYIGQAKGLFGRLNRHRQEIQSVINDRKHCLYKPLLEYGAEFGVRFSYVLSKANQHPRDVEDQLMALFAKRYHSLPVANGAGAWNRLREIVDCSP